MAEDTPKTNKLSVFAIMLVSILAALLLLPTTILLCVGMAPSIVAAYTGAKHTRKSKTMAVGSFNLSGCVPFLITLWTGQHNVPSVIEIVINPANIILMFSGAGFGYLFYFTVSGVIHAYFTGKNERRRKAIEKQCFALTERWGKDVKE